MVFKYGHKLLHRLVLRAFLLVLVLIVVSVLKIDHCVETLVPNLDKCPFYLGSKNAPDLNKSIMRLMFPFSLRNRDSLTKNVFVGLMEINLLRTNARALCVGEGSGAAALGLRDLGLLNVENRHNIFSVVKTNEVQFVDDMFDVVFSGEMDGQVVMEMERVLRPGGMGIMLVETREFNSGGLISSFLKRSSVVRACEIESFTVLMFKKRVKNPFVSLDSFNLPNNCASVARNRPFMKYLEPLLDKTEQSYLPKYMNISSRNKLLYINVGVGELAKENIAMMMDTYCSNHHKSFDAFVIDHKPTVLTSLLTDHGITFIYDPSLSGSPVTQITGPDDYASDVMEEEVFEFVPWFNETVDDGDFVVIVMDANAVQLNTLVEMFKTGAICSVDELFIKCSGDIGCKNLLESLRKTGLYVHELSGD